MLRRAVRDSRRLASCLLLLPKVMRDIKRLTIKLMVLPKAIRDIRRLTGWLFKYLEPCGAAVGGLVVC